MQSSLNIFFRPENSQVIMATATNNLPGFTIHPTDTYLYYPTERTHDLYDSVECKHEFEFLKFVQLRSGDEAMSKIDKCKKCNYTCVVV